MKKFLKGFLALAVSVLVLAGSNSGTAKAQNGGFNLVTSPIPINLRGKPGSTITTDIPVKNGGAKTEKLKVKLMKFSAYGEEGKPAIADRAKGDDYFDWVSFSEQTFDAPPNEWVNVKMTIRLPETAAFGYYYAAVFSKSEAPKPSTNKENVLVGSSAVLVLVEAQVPNAKRQAEIISFKADKKFYEFLPANFTVKIHNKGNVHLVPTGSIAISKGNKTLSTIDINKAAGNVLPNSNRLFTASWSDGYPVYKQKLDNGKPVLSEDDKPVYTIDWNPLRASRAHFGHYTAHLIMAYDNGERDVPMEATVSFWVIPWRIILTNIMKPVLPAVLVYLFMRFRLKKSLDKLKSQK